MRVQHCIGKKHSIAVHHNSNDNATLRRITPHQETPVKPYRVTTHQNITLLNITVAHALGLNGGAAALGASGPGRAI